MEFLGIISVWIIVLLLLSFKFSGCNLWSPINLYLLFWLIVLISGMYLIPIFYLKVDILLFIIIFLGINSFFVGYFGIKRVKINEDFNSFSNCCLKSRKNILTNAFFLILAMVIAYISIECYIEQISLVAVVASETDEALNSFRQAYLQKEIQIPFYIRQGSRLLMVLAYIACYSLASKLILKKGPLNIVVSLIILGLFIAETIVQAARTNIVYVLIAFIIYVSVFYVKKYRKSIPWNINMKIFSLGAFFIVFFAFLGNFMGRPDKGILETISFYFGSGILGFNQVLKNNIGYTPSFLGEGTFNGIWRCINDYIIDVGYSHSQPFLNLNGMSIGNTYTCFYSYYCDFGMMGIIIIPFIVGYCFNRFYNKVINQDCGYLIVILFGYFMHGIILSGYDELLLSSDISFGLICDMIYFYLLKIIFFKKDEGKLL